MSRSLIRMQQQVPQVTGITCSRISTKEKNQEFTPLLTEGVPQLSKLEEFFRARPTSKGRSCWENFGEPVKHETVPGLSNGGWWFLPNKDFDAACLPVSSAGKYAYEKWNKANWVKRWHGIKFEGAYSIVSDWNEPWGGLFASTDKDAGHRYLEQTPAIYGFGDEHSKGCEQYARYVPLFNDGTYVSAMLEMLWDDNHRVKNYHKTQKTNTSNLHAPHHRATRDQEPSVCPGGPSVYYAGLWVKHVGYQDIEKVQTALSSGIRRLKPGQSSSSDRKEPYLVNVSA